MRVALLSLESTIPLPARVTDDATLARGNRPHAGFLARLRRDRRGNALTIIAVAMIPLMLFVGSAVDTSRLYMVKSRLQQACDAGVLAGRKFMATTGGTTLDTNASTQATAFFNNNFKAGLFGAKNINFTPVKTSDNQVGGTATAVVPMTLTQMMGFGDTTLTVTCEARLDVSDVDVMFVLDTTGSMAYAATDTSYSGQPTLSYTRTDGTTGYYVQEKSNARIKALRTAVLNFYDTLAAAADPTTKIRYGLVPYTSTVNIGYQLPAGYLLTGQQYYQTRQVIGDSVRNYISTSTSNYTSQSACNAKASRDPATGYRSDGTATSSTVSWSNSWSGGTCTVTTATVGPLWRYARLPVDVTQYVTGASVPDPSKVTGATSKWQGCIEERDTQALTSFNQSSLPADLDPDLLVTSDATRWRPMWPDIIYDRNGYNPSVDTGTDYNNIGGGSYLQGGWVSCGKSAQRLTAMTRTDLSNYLNAPEFRPLGGTYHDTGMIWGTRLINPNGPFASDTAPPPGRNQPLRHIVFMTDGEMAPSLDIYGMYAFERYDKRVTGGDFNSQTDRHNARFLAECEAAKRRGITVWVVAFGQSLTTPLQQCASSSGNAFQASSDTALNAAFQTIAKRVAMLRLSK